MKPATSDHCRIGTLGSALTFAGQATALLVEQHERYSEPEYFSTMDAVVDAVLDGSIDGGVLTSETSNTACTDTAARLLAGEQLYIVDEIVAPYRCALLAKPGAQLADIRHVGGHGSIRQCREFLAEHVPEADVAMHGKNSVVAAEEVLNGDGTTAVIGTEAVARTLGLHILASDIDRGSAGGWWVLTRARRVEPGASVIALRIDGSERLNIALAGVLASGLRIRTISNVPTGEIFEYRYLITADHANGRPIDQRVVDQFDAELLGAFATTTITATCDPRPHNTEVPHDH